MKTLDEIKKLMSDGETAEADGALKELLAAEPENLEAKMLYGTCRQLLGDEETFKRIHDEIAPKMENKDGTELQPETVSLWRKYHELWMTLIASALILAGIGTVGWYFGREILDMFGVSESDTIGAHQRSLYAGPSYYKRQYEEEVKRQYAEEVKRQYEEEVKRQYAEEVKRQYEEEVKRQHEEEVRSLYAGPSYFKRQYEVKEEEQQKALEEDVDKIK